ncbi:YaiI/YqxD family protein [Anaeromicropila populeti]|uniref:UPF0178 protein SAMN05661086_02474 n=1 Tax=Anaeromicropila populeti TaxID=37658 RepID=A0A1I6KK96_9FIRM|nr:YaiI/YqxD family protein [Anaeromicropila populeti]SFR91468.1 hypothetical protein SAMN05661086_02474 [Anaeromicropila populeti]
MRILVDADACPTKEIVERTAQEYKIPLYFFIDTSHVLSVKYGEVITVSQGADAVDFALINFLLKGDIVVTQDYGVAAMALGKGSFAIHQSGKVFTNENIDQMLFERHLSKVQRRASKKFHGKGPKKRSQEDDIRFEEAFRRLILQILGEEAK